MKEEKIVIRRGPKGDFAEVYSVDGNKVKFIEIRKATEADKKKADFVWSHGTS